MQKQNTFAEIKPYCDVCNAITQRPQSAGETQLRRYMRIRRKTKSGQGPFHIGEGLRVLLPAGSAQKELRWQKESFKFDTKMTPSLKGVSL